VKIQSDVIRCSILLGDEAGAKAVYDDMLAAFGNHPRLPESMLFVAEEYTKRGVELGNSDDLVGARRCYLKSLVILEKILNDFPSNSYAPEVCSWAALCHRLLENYQQSIYYNQKIVDEHPDYRMAGNALFSVGHNYEKLKESGDLTESKADLKTKTAYEQLLEEYPGSQHAQYARNWLDQYNSN